MRLNRKRLLGSVARNLSVLRGFGRGPGVAGRPGDAGLWSRWPAGSPKGVLGAPLGSSCARPGAPRRGHRTAVIRGVWGLSGVLWGSWWGLARFLSFSLAHFLDELDVGPRS